MSDSQNGLPIDPKDLATVAGGFVVGLLILGLFVAIAMALHMPLLVEKWNIPMQ